MKYGGVRVVALALAAVVAAFGGLALAADAVVTMTSTGPQPAEVTVELGDKLTWVNGGSANYVIAAGRLGLTSPSIPPSGSFEYIAIRSGSFAYQQQAQDSPRRFRGTLVVLKSGTVTLASRRESVAYGVRATLTGTTTLPAFPVEIEHKPARERSWLPVATLTPTPDGPFSIAIKPTIGATYRASVLDGELVSKPLSVAVLPRVTIRSSARKILGGKTVKLSVRVVPPAAAGSVEIMRYDRRQKEWRRVTTRRLSTNGVATYLWTVPYGRTLLRGWLKKKNVEAGYAESYSAQILVQGTGIPPESNKRTNRNRLKQSPEGRERST